MAEVVLFHHAQGLTPGVAAFADALRHARHIAHTPDLFDGCTFDSIEKGMSFVHELGFGAVIVHGARGRGAPGGVGLCRYEDADSAVFKFGDTLINIATWQQVYGG